MGYGIRVLSAKMEVRLKFLDLTRREELNNVMSIPDLTTEDAHRRFNELFGFAERVLFHPKNRHSMDRILSPNPFVQLMRSLFCKRPDSDLVSKDPDWVIFKDFQTGAIYRFRVQELVPGP